MTGPITGIPAATVIIFRHGRDGGPAELLMTERSSGMRFAGGAAVFPGGRIDESDRHLAARIAPHIDPDDAASRVAAVREALEETGLLLATSDRVSAETAERARQLLAGGSGLHSVCTELSLAVEIEALVPWARWCPNWSGAFDTRFYLADVGTGELDLTGDARETSSLFWASARDVLAMARRGDLSIIFPTECNLERLALFDSFAAAADHARQFPVKMITPFRTDIDGVEHLTIPDDRGYPVVSRPSSRTRQARPESLK